MRGPARIATYLARILIAAGLALLALGWNGAASLDYLQGQFPYLLSASVPGLALIVAGVAVEFVQTVREVGARRAREAAQLEAAVARLGNAAGGGGWQAGDGRLSL